MVRLGICHGGNDLLHPGAVGMHQKDIVAITDERPVRQTGSVFLVSTPIPLPFPEGRIVILPQRVHHRIIEKPL